MSISRSTVFLGLIATFTAILSCVCVDVPAQSVGVRQVVVEPTGKLESPGRLRVFIVAASKYPRGILRLACTPNDAEALKELFVKKLGASEGDVVFLSSRGATELADYPSKSNIEEGFAEFVDSLRPGDLAIVYLSGHGMQFEGSRKSWFLPEDVKTGNLLGTSVSIDDMMTKLSESEATFRWLIVDACRNDPVVTKGGQEEDKPILASRAVNAKELGAIADVPETVALLQSCQPGKKSYEGGYGSASSIENGFFTLSLLEALDKEKGLADANKDGKITFSEMFEYVSRETDRKARDYYGFSQVPNLSGNITNFALIDGVLKDGLTIEEWNKADGLYQEACVLRRAKNFVEARKKIAAARKINALNEAYQLEEETIQGFLDAEANVADTEASSARLQAQLAETQAQLAKAKAAQLAAEAALDKAKKEEAEAARKKAEEAEARARVADAEASRLEDAAAQGPTSSGFGDSKSRKADTRLTIKVKRWVEFGLCWCPAGTFLMGSPKSEEGWCSDETQHRVTLSHGFWLGETEVTKRLWEEVMEDNPRRFERRFEGDDLPVENVSWEDAHEFLTKLNALGVAPKGMKFALPTEAQWEYACRAGTTTPFSWGDKLNGDKANCDGSRPYGTSVEGKKLGETSPVKSYAPNAWGLYDMHGNVCEWCEDWYDDYPSGAVTDPTGPASGSHHVNRGGGWNDAARGCRAAFRNYYHPVDGSGFRVACVAEQ